MINSTQVKPYSTKQNFTHKQVKQPSFAGYNEAVDEWKQSKSDIQAALKVLGNKEVSVVMQGPSFPSNPDEDIAIGSPYAAGAKRFKDFFDGIIKTNILGPWGITSRGDGGYGMHSPYTSTLESLNPFFINFKFLTTPEGGELIAPATFENVVANNPAKQSKSDKAYVNYIYAEDSINMMLDEAFKTYQRKLNSKDASALKLEAEINTFKNENSGIILDAAYCALTKKYGTGNYKQWNELDQKLPVLLGEKDQKAAERLETLCQKEAKDDIDKYIFTQLLAKKHAENNNFRPYNYVADKQVAIVGPDSWKLQDLILQEINGKKISLGVPPDMFSTAGRNWGMDVLDPRKLFDKNGNLTDGGKRIYKIFRNVFHSNRGGVRIDHFIGIIDPYVCVNGSADPKDGAGRLLSSPDSPVLGSYAIKDKDPAKRLEKYGLMFEKIILQAAKDEGLSEKDIIPEDVGAVTEPVKAIMDKYNLSSMKITQFVTATEKNHQYRGKNAAQKDAITTGTHDTPPLVSYFADMDASAYDSQVNMLSEDLKIKDKAAFYTKNGKNGRTEAVKAKFAELFASPAQNVHLFFTHLLGLDDYYNKPGDKSVNKWRAKMPNDFEKVYFKNMLRGTSFNPFDALTKALIASGRSESDPLVQALQKHQSRLMDEIQDMINKENPNYNYNPLETGIPSIEERNQRFPKDAQYRKVLAEAIGEADPDKLSSVIGIEELSAVLRNAKESYFRTGGVDAKTGLPNNSDFRVNLHIHTQGSDGKMKIEELLDQQAEFARKSGHPVLFAVTNHDTLDDARKAIQIIAAHPEKYKDILFVPGIEFNAKYRNDKIFNAGKGSDYALQLEEIGYSINPFDKKLNEFLETRREANKSYVQTIIDRYNEWGLGASIQEARSSSSHLRYVGSPGLIAALKDYIQGLFAKKGWIWKDDQGHDGEKIIRDMSDKFGRIHITPSTPSYKEVINVVEESGSGAVGLAHPGRIGLKGIDVDGNFAIKTLVDDFAKAGGKYVDYNYQYPDIDKNPGWQTWVNGINEYIDFKHPEIIKAGGMDNHGQNIFNS